MLPFQHQWINRRRQVPDFPLCLLNFLIMMIHKHQFNTFEMKMTILRAFTTVYGERQPCPRSQSHLKGDRWNRVVSLMPLLVHELYSSGKRQMDVNHMENLMLKGKRQWVLARTHCNTWGQVAQQANGFVGSVCEAAQGHRPIAMMMNKSHKDGEGTGAPVVWEAEAA